MEQVGLSTYVWMAVFICVSWCYAQACIIPRGTRFCAMEIGLVVLAHCSVFFAAGSLSLFPTLHLFVYNVQ